MTGPETTVPHADGTAPRVLMLYYSYSGQARKVLETAGQVFADRGADVSYAAIEFTDPTYSPRFARFPLRRVWPDMLSVLSAQQKGVTGQIRIPAEVGQGPYDLICIGSPTWWKAPSMPLRSFLKSSAAPKLFADTPFAVFTVCRTFWQENFEEVCKLAEAAGGRYTDEIHFTYPGDTARSMLALTSYLGSGRYRERYLGIRIPRTNVSEEQFGKARKFAAALATRILGI